MKNLINSWFIHLFSALSVLSLHLGVAYWVMSPKESIKKEPQILKIQMISASPPPAPVKKIEKPTPTQMAKVAPKPILKPQPQKITPSKPKKILADRGLTKSKEILKKPVMPMVEKIKIPTKTNEHNIAKKQAEINNSQPYKTTSQANTSSKTSSNIVSQNVNTGYSPITKPSTANYLNNPAPNYPQMARRRRQEGTVILNVLVSKLGTAKQISISNSSGYSLLDESAMNAVRSWKFIPAKQGDLALEMSVKVPIKFQLR